MAKPLILGGRQCRIRAATAREMLDIEEQNEKPRDVNRHVMAVCIVDAKTGEPVFTPDAIEDLSTPEYRDALEAIWKANRPPKDDDAKKD